MASPGQELGNEHLPARWAVLEQASQQISAEKLREDGASAPEMDEEANSASDL